MSELTPLTLSMTGPFRVTDPSGAEVAGLSRRGQALLAVLAKQPNHTAERGWLADLLWSDRGEAQARASLRQELSQLRRVLPDGVLDADRQRVRICPGALRTVTDAPGPPLQGFDLNSEGFEDWLRDLRQAPAPSPGPDTAFLQRPAVLLFAFETLSGSPEDAMIATGLAGDLRTTLGYWRWFPVVAPESIGWKTVKDVDLRETCRSCNATYAIAGTLMRMGQRIRIAVGLTDAESGRSLWSRTFEGDLQDVFMFQDEVSRAIVAEIEPQLAAAEAAKITRAKPTALAPWQLMAMADEIDRKSGEGYGTPEDNDAQLALMERALEAKPDFCAAYARMGKVWFRKALLGWSDDRDAAFDRSIELSSKAIQLDPEDCEAHAYQGLARVFGRQDYDIGIFHAREAVRLNPSAAIARHALGCGLEWYGGTEEALDHLRLIFRFNPLYPGRAAALGDVCICEMFEGNRDAALDAARRLAAMAPDYARGLQRVAATLGWFDRRDEAAPIVARLRTIQPGFDEDYVRQTYPYARPEHRDAIFEGLRKAGAFDQP